MVNALAIWEVMLLFCMFVAGYKSSISFCPNKRSIVYHGLFIENGAQLIFEIVLKNAELGVDFTTGASTSLSLETFNFCYRISRLLKQRFVVTMTTADCISSLLATLNISEEKQSALQVDDFDPCKIAMTANNSLLDNLPSSPYLSRLMDAHVMPYDDVFVQYQCEFIRSITSSYGDEALDALDVPMWMPFPENSDQLPISVGGNSNTLPTRLLCIVYTIESHHSTQIKQIMKSWGSRCSGFLAFSNATSEEFPYVIVKIDHVGEESYGNMWQKIIAILKYVHASYLEEFDWFLFCGDDTYIVTGHLLDYLRSSEIQDKLHEGQGVYIGRQFRIDGADEPSNITFNTGGSGYILDKVALIRLIAGLAFQIPECNIHMISSAEDVNVALCLRHFGIIPMDTRDNLGRERFHHFNPSEVWRFEPSETDWWVQHSLPDTLYGRASLSPTSIGFHWLDSFNMEVTDYFFMQCKYWPEINH